MRRLLMVLVLAVLTFTATAKEVKWGKPFDYVTTIPSDLADAKCYGDWYHREYSATTKALVPVHLAAVDAKCKKYDGKFLVTRTYFKRGERVESSFSSETYIKADKITTIIYIYDTYDEAKAAYKAQQTTHPNHNVELKEISAIQVLSVNVLR